MHALLCCFCPFCLGRSAFRSPCLHLWCCRSFSFSSSSFCLVFFSFFSSASFFSLLFLRFFFPLLFVSCHLLFVSALSVLLFAWSSLLCLHIRFLYLLRFSLLLRDPYSYLVYYHYVSLSVLIFFFLFSFSSASASVISNDHRIRDVSGSGPRPLSRLCTHLFSC